MEKPRLLIIEDDDLQYEIYEESFSAFDLTRVTNGSQAIAAIAKVQPQLVILDHVLSDGELGLRILPQLKELLPHVPVIVVSGALEVQQQIMALQGPRRAHYCVPKPVDIRQLRQLVTTALRDCGPTEVVRQFEALEKSKRVDAVELFSRSTDRLARQNKLLETIGKSKDRPNISALAREHKVARRTIIRDLQELIRRGQLGADVYPEWETDASEEGE